MRILAVRDSESDEVLALAGALQDPYTLDYWLRRVWTVVPDPPDAEYVLSPATIISCQFFAGDCDDAATLAASILRALRIPSQLIAIRTMRDVDFSHVFCRVPSYRLDIDPIVPFEHMPVRYAEAMILHV
jgi:transglutaminase-like putative cysteine protease